MTAALIGVIAVALSVVIGGPMAMLVERQQARAATDASALAILWWGAAVAEERGSMVTVQVGNARAQAAASDPLDG